mmetsp:Transcript_13891/g.19157  ORF Transcript_13891/g.19157 Transcript_13891/m.19157 type:complete len:561 (-) Transcript_13891:126-1808(-)|eukprot:CAMPEP_0201488854 /NCGR_PEP_ID=MMETSP0151_2-20130828/19880_1 /ASSEMBLY_ACC=CAM_ASM_000257 /TAXON_ID=200890 /ORGANISM="Paramoeba atlantica, Strain 621/1 / CCAP 1560/9" /LENGTH=560 /DNA_ID=CAMNT_0047874243 /DNA_START=112 /DNA_END=1794 /DNA_ORIENTATION=-
MADESESPLRTRCDKIQSEIHELWSREILQTTVDKDLPRFAARSVVVQFEENGNPTVLFSGQQFFEKLDEEEQYKLPIEMLKALTTPKKLRIANRKKFIKKVEETFQGEQDLGKAFREFITQDKAFQEESYFFDIIRCINQEIPFPIVKMLRDSIHGQLPFKDKRGSWYIRVLVFPHEIVVKHIKTNMAYTSEPNQQFEFTWELVLTICENHTVRYDFQIFDVSIGKQVPEKTRNMIEEVFKPHLPKGHEARSVWRRGLEDGDPVCSGICTFCTNFKMSRYDDAVLDRVDFPFSLESAYDMMFGITKFFGENEIGARLEKGFWEELDRENTMKDNLLIIWKKGIIPVESRTCQVLKALNPDMASSAVMEMRKDIYPKMKFRGDRKTWKAEVQVCDAGIAIFICKRERSESIRENLFFQFEWECGFLFDQYMTKMLDSQWRISSLNFHEHTEASIQEHANEVLAGHLSPTRPWVSKAPAKVEEVEPNKVRSMTYVHALQLLSRSLRPEEDRLKEIPIPGDKPISVLELVDSMHRSAVRSEHPLPTVYLSRREKWSIGSYKN